MSPLWTNPYRLLMRTGSQEDLLSFPLSLSPLLFSLALATLSACLHLVFVCEVFPPLNFIVVNYVWEGCASKQDPASAVPLPLSQQAQRTQQREERAKESTAVAP